MKKISLVVLLICSIFICGFFGSKSKDAVATIGSKAITNADLNEKIKTYPAQIQQALQTKETKARVLSQIVDEAVLIKAAKNAKYFKTKEYKTQVENAKNQIAISLLIRDKIDNQATITEDDLVQYFQNNPDKFKAIEQRKARHILCKTKKEAYKIRQATRKGRNFSSLAKKKSQDKGTAENGGDLGWFTKGQLVPAFEKAAYKLNKGQLSQPVKTKFGYHIIKLDDIKARPALKYEAVKNSLKQSLTAEKKKIAMDKLLTDLKEQYKVKVNAANIK
jgi:peptidyl-prolyl cis-trans isomerase C